MTGGKLDNIKLEKIYSLSPDLFRDGFRAYQKKFVYPKSYLLMAVFLILALNFVYGAVNAPDNYLAYIMIVACLALMVREWFNPRRIRRIMTDTVRDIGTQQYKFTLADGFAEFSTIEHGNVENSAETTETSESSTELSTIQPENVENFNEPAPPSVIPAERLRILEYDSFFLFLDGKAMFYIVPKDNFSDEEISLVRNLDKN